MTNASDVKDDGNTIPVLDGSNVKERELVDKRVTQGTRRNDHSINCYCIYYTDFYMKDLFLLCRILLVFRHHVHIKIL